MLENQEILKYLVVIDDLLIRKNIKQSIVQNLLD